MNSMGGVGLTGELGFARYLENRVLAWRSQADRQETRILMSGEGEEIGMTMARGTHLRCCHLVAKIF